MKSLRLSRLLRLRCASVRKYFVAYLDRELGADRVNRVERHVTDCGHCRADLVALRTGRRFALDLPSFPRQNDGWPALEAALNKEDREVAKSRSTQGQPGRLSGWSGGAARPTFRPAGRPVMWGAGLVIIFLAAGVFALYAKLARDGAKTGGRSGWVVDTRDFHAVTIDEIGQSTDPHVVAEGFVSEVRRDEEEGDMTFRLVGDLKHSGPFIVCEIVSPINVAPPAVGSHVKVFGVSRYDAKSDHQWYEVHPVLDIEAMPR